MRSAERKNGTQAAGDGSIAQADLASGAGREPETLMLEAAWEEQPVSPPARRVMGMLMPVLAIAAIIGWTSFYAWALQSEWSSAATQPPLRWAEWLTQWSVPVLLIGVGWLIAMRSSRREASRFATSAALLSRESAQLEDRLTIVNRELSLAREFLASQSRELESLGRIAAERISTHAAELQQLVVDNGAQVDAIAATSETALGNMNRLRDDLPVVAHSARDVANQIGGAGRTAQEQLERLIAGFERLNQFGAASGKQVDALALRTGEALSGFETQVDRIEQRVTARFDDLQQRAGDYRERLDTLEDEALVSLRARVERLADEATGLAERLEAADTAAQERLRKAFAALHAEMVNKLEQVDELDRTTGAAAQRRIVELRAEAERFDELLRERDRRFDELIEQRAAAFDTRETQASEVLAQRLAALDDALAQRREAQITDAEKLVAHGTAIAAQLDELRRLLIAASEQGDAARTSLAAGLGRFGEQLADKRAALAQTERQMSELTESGIRLLEIIQAGIRTSRDDLPVAIATATDTLEAVEGRTGEIGAMMLRSAEQGSHLADYLVRTRSEIAETETAIAALSGKIGAQADETLARLQGLRGGFARLAEESGELAGDTQERLREALAALETAIAGAFDTLDAGTRDKTAALAESIGADAVQALERALRNETAATIGKIEQAAAHASGVGREATIQLRDQLVRVNELTGNLEQRVSRARELAEEQINNDFARRMALVTDSLNSAAIDISQALSTEVSDTAWDAYLKGDRGNFTRRAVRLLDNSSLREIAELYQADETFRHHVGRYIHDFEAMLRSMLSTRDGHAISVTMLGSDMGKLYVALAQAIQRFRN